MRILIVKTGSLGDLFHALPAVHLLKTGLNAQIDWVVSSDYAPLVECFDDVERVISLPKENLFPLRQGSGQASLWRFLSDLRRERYDLVVDLQGRFKSALIARTARSHKRIGPSFHREFSYLFYDHVAAERNKERHAVDENLDVLRFLDLPAEPILFPITFPPSSSISFTSHLPHPTSHILISPCSRHAANNWPVERFAAVGTVLHEQTGADIYISGVPQDFAVCKKLESLLPRGAVHNLCGKTSLVELGRVLQAMDLVITVDSGPMHMAAALGIPTLAVFGPTDPVRAGPYGSANRVVRCTEPGKYSRTDINGILEVTTVDVVAVAEEMPGTTPA
jgi:lipopolysaccharide heptosyltransferase I